MDLIEIQLQQRQIQYHQIQHKDGITIVIGSFHQPDFTTKIPVKNISQKQIPKVLETQTHNVTVDQGISYRIFQLILY